MIAWENISKNNLFYAAIIGLAVFCILGLPFTNWGFLHDDFGLWHIWNAKLKDVMRFFIEESSGNFIQPTNFNVPEQTFFTILYRPLYNVFLLIQRFFFGVEPYGYFLVTIFFMP